MSETPVISTDGDGRIRGLNKAATELLGDARGRRCRDVVVARDPTRRILCTQMCAKNLIDAGEQRDVTHVTVRGEDFRMMCTGTGEGGVVSLLEAVPTEEVREPLTPRELEILAMVAEGLTSKRIARRLGVAFCTVRTHLERARGKLGARSRAEAVVRAVRSGQLKITQSSEPHMQR